MIYKGGCHCGNIHFEISTEKYETTHCHCGICRKTTGAAFVSWFTVKRGAFRLLKGKPMSYASSSYAMRQFCPTCGAQITFQSDKYPDEIDIALGLLDHAENIEVSREIWTDKKLHCIKLEGISVSRRHGSE